MKRLITLLITLVLLFSCMACSGCPSDSSTSNVPTPVVPSYSGEVGTLNAGNRVSYVGTHEISATDTETNLVENGASEYKIIMPEVAGPMVIEAKNDFLILFKKATGVSLSVQTDSNVVDFDQTKKYISLGETALVELAGIDKSEYSKEKLKDEGIRIITKGNTVFLLGGSDFGVNNSVYKFLEIYFNFDYYQRNFIYIDTNVQNCKFKNIDLTDVPDIDHFFGSDYLYQYGKGLQSYDTLGLGVETAAEEIGYINHRSGSHLSTNQLLMPIHVDFDTSSDKATTHNALTYIPKGVGHSDWYSDSGLQLCFTAHGKPEELEQMLDFCAEKIIFSLKHYTPDKYPYLNYAPFTMEDNSAICSCAACQNEYETIKHSGCLIRFCNKLAQRVDEWLESQKDESAEFHYAYRENFKVLTFGYNVYTAPPVDENFQPLAEDLYCHERLGIWHVSCRGISPFTDVYDTEHDPNQKNYSPDATTQVKGWKEITKNSFLWFWHNSGNVQNNEYFSDGFTIYSNNFFELMSYGGYEYIYAAHFLGGSYNLTAWQNLLVYVQNKLRWDHTRSMDFYIEKYMKGMFYDGAEKMLELLKSERLHYQQLVNTLEPDAMDWGGGIRSTDNYPYAKILSWIALCNDALKEIEYLKDTDQTLYKVVYQNIEIEAAAHVWKLLDLYKDATARPFSNDVLESYKKRLVTTGTNAPGLKLGGIAIKDYK